MSKKEILNLCDEKVYDKDIQLIEKFINKTRKNILIGIFKFIIELLVSVLGILLFFCIVNKDFSCSFIVSKLPFLLMFSLPFLFISLYFVFFYIKLKSNFKKALTNDSIKRSKKSYIFFKEVNSNEDNKKKKNKKDLTIYFHMKGRNKKNYIYFYTKNSFILYDNLEKNKEYYFYNINDKLFLIL